MTNVTSPLFSSQFSLSCALLSKNSMQYRISQDTQTVGLAIHHNYVIGCQTYLNSILVGFKKIQHYDDRSVVA